MPFGISYFIVIKNTEKKNKEQVSSSYYKKKLMRKANVKSGGKNVGRTEKRRKPRSD